MKVATTKVSTKIKEAPKPANSGETFYRKSNRAKNLTGNEYGRLTVQHDTGKRSNKKIVWACLCSCGNTTEVRSSHLIGLLITSCGCLAQEQAVKRAAEGNGVVKKTHGKSATRIYTIYRAMIQRCYDKSQTSFKNYGERGICVCKRWLGKNGFKNWLTDMGEPPDDSLTLERKNVHGNYTPSNCEWATKKTQARNKQSNVYVTWQGQQVLLIELAEQYHVPYKVLHQRIQQRKWSVERAITQPLRKSP